MTAGGQEVRYAGFWLRLAAMLIDTLLIIAITFPLLVYIYGWGYFNPARTGFFAGTADILISWMAPAIAVIVFWRAKQATPGKMLLSMKVVDAAGGGPLSIERCIGRYFAYAASILPAFLGFVWIAFDKKKQGFHDKLAGSVVVRAETD